MSLLPDTHELDPTKVAFIALDDYYEQTVMGLCTASSQVQQMVAGIKKKLRDNVIIPSIDVLTITSDSFDEQLVTTDPGSKNVKCSVTHTEASAFRSRMSDDFSERLGSFRSR